MYLLILLLILRYIQATPVPWVIEILFIEQSTKYAGIINRKLLGLVW
jgi:hypothetical protein